MDAESSERPVIRGVARPEPLGTFASLHIRNFRLFIIGQTVSQSGSWMTKVAQTLLVLHLTHGSGTAVGLLAMCQSGPVLVLGPWAGLVVDRHRRQRLLLVLQVIGMAESVALATVMFEGFASFRVICLLATLQGTVTAFDNPARQTFVVELVDDRHRHNAISLNAAAMTGSRVVGPALAGVVIAVLGTAWCFAIDAASYVATLVCLLGIRRGELFAATPIARARGQIREGLQTIRRSRALSVPFVMMALVGIFGFNFSTSIPLFVKGALAGTDGQFAALFAVLSVGSVTGALLMAKRTTARFRELCWAAFAFGAGLATLAMAPNLWMAFPPALLVGAGSMIFVTAATTTIQAATEEQFRGRIMSIHALVLIGSTPIGGPLMGAAVDTAGPRAGVGVGAVGCVGASLFGWWSARPAQRQVGTVPTGPV